MLTADLALSWRRGKSTGPRYIDAEDVNYLRVAEALIYIVEQHRDRPREELERALDQYIGAGTDYKILRGLIKLIMDGCQFEATGKVEPPAARRALFHNALAHHPVDESTRRQVIAETAAQLGCAPEELIHGLYADLPDRQKLIAFEGVEARQLLDRYNLAQAQALLYRSVEMRLWVEPQEPSSLRQLFSAIKAYRLIHTVEGKPETGYEIRLSGPLSVFHRSQKYGVQMAVFLPALLPCRGWRMRAEIAVKSGGSAFFELSSKDHRLRSHYVVEPAGENLLANKLIAGWAKTKSLWSLEASREIISLGESAFIPDLVARHPLAEPVYVEILGFWTPRYLGERLKQFERAGFTRFCLALSEELRGSREAPARLPENVLPYKTSISAESLNRALEGFVT
jgi:predicted nuclease of restriction endonuclease-like RecB superfamily